jgi:hypothetical protein
MQNTKNPLRIAAMPAVLFLAGAFFAQPAPAVTNELVSQLTKSLSVTPQQASGGAGALFGMAKSQLSAADFGKIAAVVPGIEGMIKSAPKVKSTGGIPGISSIEKSLPGGLGGLASVAGQFQKLGLSPDMVSKFIPILTQFVQAKGGSGVASLLSGVLK